MASGIRRCVDLVRDIVERGITISIDENGFLRASPREKAEALFDEMKKFRHVMAALATGFRSEGYRRETKRAVKISCEGVFKSGVAQKGCLYCEQFAVWTLEDGLTGLCVSRTPVGKMDFSEEKGKRK